MENLKKIRTIGKVSKIVALVVCILAFVGAGLALIGAAVLASIPESWVSVSAQVNGTLEVGSSLSVWEEVLKRIGGTGENSFGSWSVEGGKLLLSLRSPDFENIPLTKMAALVVTAGMFQLVFYGVIFLFVSKFAKALEKNNSPFCDACIKYLKITAYVLLGWAVVGKTALKFVGGLFFGSLRGGLSVDAGLILISLVFLLLAYIFQYGAKLQREADETL